MAEPLTAGVEGIPLNGRARPPAGRPEPIPPDLLRDSAMRAAFAQRDIATVYVKLGHRGVSQRRIAALTAQSQSEISEIISGRQVTSVALLERIADGLGVPRAWLGLADAGQPAVPPVPQPRRGRPPRPAPPTLSTPALMDLAEDSPLVQLVARAFVAGLLMSDGLEPFRNR